MKDFHLSNGVIVKRLLTVGELLSELAKYPHELPVAAVWEGQTMPLGFGMSVEDYGLNEDRCQILSVEAEYDDGTTG